MRVCLCGGGNAVHVMASDMGARDDLWVGIYAPYQDEAERMQAGLDANNGEISRRLRGQFTSGKPNAVSANPADVVPGADIVLIPLPSFSHPSILKEIAPHLKDGCIIVALPGQGGFNWLARSVLGSRASQMVIAGTNQLPYQCRILSYGSDVELIGHKRNIKVATEPAEKSAEVARVLTDLIGVTQVDPLPHFLSVTLTPANQVIHPTIMYGLFHDYEAPLAEKPLFYQNTDDFTADIMTKTSNDVLNVAAAVRQKTGLDIPVDSLDEMMREMYSDELADPSTMKSIFRSNLGYQGLVAPMLTTGDGRFVPDFGYRYLTEDIPRGLCVLKGVAQIAGVETPAIDLLIRWASTVMNKHYLADDNRLDPENLPETAAPQSFGFDTIESII